MRNAGEHLRFGVFHVAWGTESENATQEEPGNACMHAHGGSLTLTIPSFFSSHRSTRTSGSQLRADCHHATASQLSNA